MGVDFFAPPAAHSPTSPTAQSQPPSTTLTTSGESVSTALKLNRYDVRLTNQAHKLQDRRLAIYRKKPELDLEERQLNLDEEKFKLLKQKRVLDEEDKVCDVGKKKGKTVATKTKASGRPNAGAKKTTAGVAKSKSQPATRRVRLKTSTKNSPIKVETESETEKAHEEGWGEIPHGGLVPTMNASRSIGSMQMRSNT